MFAQRRLYQRLVCDVALHEGDVLRHGPAEAGDQIVDHHHAIAGILQRQHRMAADIAGAARDQNRWLAHKEKVSPNMSGET